MRNLYAALAPRELKELLNKAKNICVFIIRQIFNILHIHVLYILILQNMRGK